MTIEAQVRQPSSLKSSLDESDAESRATRTRSRYFLRLSSGIDIEPSVKLNVMPFHSRMCDGWPSVTSLARLRLSSSDRGCRWQLA